MTDEKEARGPVTHVLKTDPAPFADLLVGRKNSEVRQADRDYQVGDRLALRETTLSAQKRGILRVEAQYTGRELIRTITHIQRDYGLPDGIAVLSLSQLPPSAPPAAPIDEPRLDAPAQVGNARFGKGVPHRFVTARRPQRCERCSKHRKPFLAKPDCREWIEWKLTDESWQRWREENPDAVAEMRTAIDMAPARKVGTAERTPTGGEAQCAR